MKIEMVTKQPHLYGGKRLKAGDAFQVSGESDAKLLTALGRAERKTPAVLTAPTLTTPEIENLRQNWQRALTGPRLNTPEIKPKRKYTRRDMTAER